MPTDKKLGLWSSNNNNNYSKYLILLMLVATISCLNGPSAVSLTVYFRSFQTPVKLLLLQINVKISPSSIWCWDLNSQPTKHEFTPLTTRKVLPPNNHSPNSLISGPVSNPSKGQNFSCTIWVLEQNKKLKVSKEITIRIKTFLYV